MSAPRTLRHGNSAVGDDGAQSNLRLHRPSLVVWVPQGATRVRVS